MATEREDRDVVLALLGIARRAGAIAIGAQAISSAAKSGKLRLVVLAEDASVNAAKRLGRAADETTVVAGPSRDEIGRALGRPPIAAVGVTDAGLATRLAGVASTPGSQGGPKKAAARRG